MFCAFELPEDLRTIDRRARSKVREAVPEAAASWSRPDNIHLTVKFFGNVDQASSRRQSPAAAARVVKEFSPIQIAVGKTGVFPRPSRPQVLWIGVADPSGVLLPICNSVWKMSLRVKGFRRRTARSARTSRLAASANHRTRGRWRDTHLRTQVQEVEVTLSELVLFRSELSPKGSKYTAISRHRLEH